MKMTTRGVVALALLAVLAAPAAWAAPGETAGFETYVVRPGDTLSKIAGRVYGDVGRWREILAQNPQVTNANRIFPGDALRIPILTAATPRPEGAVVPAPETGIGAVQDSGAVADQRAADTAPGPVEEGLAIPDLPVETVRSAAVVNPMLYRSAGYFSDCLPALAIIGAEDERVLIATGDAALVNAPLPPGARFTVVRAERRIFHPQTGCYLGWLTRVLGTAEVTCGDELTSTVVLRQMRDAATVGDYLVPFDPDDVLEENALPGKAGRQCVAPGGSDGVIVAFDEEQPMAVEQEFAYIDRGASFGVAPGGRYTIYRKGVPAGLVQVGELQVLRAGESTATALITTSIREVQVGDLLWAR
jgi:hypothetical protein